MAQEWEDIGSAPHGEDCAQLGEPGYPIQAQRECNRLIRQLRKEQGEEPLGARLAVKANPHDFGTYYSVDELYRNHTLPVRPPSRYAGCLPHC